MAPLPVAVLLGIYLGVLTGIVPAIVAFALGFLFRYVTGVSIPAFAVVVLGVAIAGVNGGLLALVDPAIVSSSAAPTIIPALLVVLMITIYAHDRGNALGERVPRRVTLRGISRRTLSADVVRRIGDRGRVTVRVVGEVEDLEGYPGLPSTLRRQLNTYQVALDAAPLHELEAAFADRLRTTFDLAEVQVEIDERARASVRTAPPLAGVGKWVGTGERAVSIETLVPTGMARGDVVTVRADTGEIDGRVVSVQSAESGRDESMDPSSPADPVAAATGDDQHEFDPPAHSAPSTAAGGEGRVTIAVARAAAELLLTATTTRLTVGARGTHREYELLSLLRRMGLRFRKLAVGAGHREGHTLADLELRETYGVAILALRRPDGWTVAPRGTATIREGDEVFAVGTREGLDSVAEAFA